MGDSNCGKGLPLSKGGLPPPPKARLGAIDRKCRWAETLAKVGIGSIDMAAMFLDGLDKFVAANIFFYAI